VQVKDFSASTQPARDTTITQMTNAAIQAQTETFTQKMPFGVKVR